jgi:hypothetical protein
MWTSSDDDAICAPVDRLYRIRLWMPTKRMRDKKPSMAGRWTRYQLNLFAISRTGEPS